jgi:hypothetical protein
MNGLKSVPSILGWVIFLAVIANNLRGYGQQWEFGRYGMPSTLVAADGEHHLDGTPVPGVVLAIKNSGREEEAELAALAFVAAVLLWLVYGWRNERRGEQRIQRRVRQARNPKWAR